MYKQIHIFDMDGTIVDSLHRFRVDPATGRLDQLQQRFARCGFATA